MRNINTFSLAEAKNRFVILVLVMMMMTLSSGAACQAAAAISAPVVRKAQQWQRESQSVISFSRRLYRFYKLSSEKELAQARMAE